MGQTLEFEMGIKCKCKYYDRWHSEMMCYRYEQPTRMCCPCDRPEN